MENIRILSDIYSIYESGTNCAEEVAEFIVRENFRHHLSRYDIDCTTDKFIKRICADELQHEESLFYLARTKEGKLIGSIRVFKWNRKDTLPIEQIFHINPLEKIGKNKNCSYWHVGRFAIDHSTTFSTLTLFKELMALAIDPIVNDPFGYMIAETDCKLLRTMRILGINATIIGAPVNYLASMTVPIYSSKNDLRPYYERMAQTRKIFKTHKSVNFT